MEEREGSPFAETLGALLAPRRLVPYLAVAGPIVAAEAVYSGSARVAGVAAALCVAFWLLAPAAWRRLCPTLATGSRPRAWLGLAAYLLFSVVTVFAIGLGLALALGLRPTDDVTLLVMTALFAVGGWGLGRDIDLELGLARERRRAERLAEEAERAGLLALRAHLDPHFLFNTLNAVAELCRQDPEAAEAATLRLASMLRSVLAGVREPSWPLARELELCRELLELHRVRDPERFASEVEVDGPLPGGVRVPPMILLPLVENAMKHGPGAGHRGAVRVEVEAAGPGVRIAVRNPGAFRGRRPEGEGLAMVERRLALAYGGAARLSIAAEGEETRAELVLPATPSREVA